MDRLMEGLNTTPREYGRSNRPSYPAKAGYLVRYGFSIQSQASLEYWVTRPSAQSRTRRVTTVRYAAGTGSAVTDLIFSIANREVTFFNGTALISFL